MEKLLSEAQLVLEELAPSYFHGTAPKFAENILKNGLDPSKSKYSSTIYMTVSQAEATKYSKIANNGKLGTLLRIDSKGLDDRFIQKNYNGIVEYTGPLSPEFVKKFH